MSSPAKPTIAEAAGRGLDAVDGARAASGPLLFARHAYPPNVLGYCGGDAVESLVGHVVDGVDDRELRALCREFEGAGPYLDLIAASAGLADPLDRRVVEAYWIGNDLLDRVRVGAFGDSLRDRFRDRTARREWPWLAAKPADGARPHHSFHVLEVFPRIGLLRSGHVQDVVERMDRCLVRPARIVEVDARALVVRVRPLALRDGRLVCGPPRLERVEHAAGGRTAIPGASVGEWVTTHWGRACDRIDARQLAALEAATARSLRLANRTI